MTTKHTIRCCKASTAVDVPVRWQLVLSTELFDRGCQKFVLNTKRTPWPFKRRSLPHIHYSLFVGLVLTAFAHLNAKWNFPC